MADNIGQIAADITRLSEGRKSAWSKADSVNPDADFTDYIFRLAGTTDLEVTKALLRTFDDAFDDGGTQEHVCGLLTTIPEDVISNATSEVQDELRQRAPEWLESLLKDFPPKS